MDTVLISGATGVVGAALTRELLGRTDAQLRLLVRAGTSEQLAQRRAELLDFCGVDRDDPAIQSRVEAFNGDVTAARLGLDELVHRRLTSEVTHIVHSAGSVKLNRPWEEARRLAVESAGHVVAFARACADAGRLRKLEFVSTVGVAGSLGPVVPERILTEARAFRNSYEAAKAEAEVLVWQAVEQGVRATVHRPSMVVGDSRDGRIRQFQVFYHLCEFLSGTRTRGIIPEADDARLDIVPVDYVAGALRRSIESDEAAGRVFHLCAGPEGAPRIRDLATRVRAAFVAHGRQVPRLRAVPPMMFRALTSVAGRLMPTTAGALRSLPYFLAYLETPQTFANAESRRFFSAAGLDLPRLDAYLDPVLSRYLSSGAVGAARPAAVGAA